MEKQYSEIVFALEDYREKITTSDLEARTMMWQDIAKQLEILTKNNYVAIVYDDDVDIIVIQYEHDEHIEPWGCANPYWLTEEDVELLEQAKTINSEPERESYYD